MLHYLWKGQKLRFALVLVFLLAASAALAYIPVAFGDMIDTLTQQQNVDILALVLRLTVILVVGSLILWIGGLIANAYSARRMMMMEQDLAEKLLTKPRAKSRVLNIYNQELALISEKYLGNITFLVQELTASVITIALGSVIAWELVLWVLGISAVVMGCTQLFAKRLARFEKALQEKNTAATAMISGVFSAVRTVVIFSANRSARKKLGGAFEDKRRAAEENRNVSVNVSMIAHFLGWVAQYGMIIGSYIMVYFGTLDIGEAVTLTFLMQYMVSPMFTVMNAKNSMVSTRDVRRDLVAILNEPGQTVTKTLAASGMELRKLFFSYTDEPFMSGLDAAFDFGGRYLIVGASGSGKSTLMKLLLKELTPQGGAITSGGEDIASLNAPTWFQNIAYVGQTVELLPGTLRENIVLDSAYDEPRFAEIGKLLQIEYLKYDEPLTEDMNNFSGGELQRIAIARALYSERPMLMFDEFSSSLDNENARKLEEELLRIRGKLLISISHRIHADLLGLYDKIFILENGSIKSAGSAAELQNDLRPFLSAPAQAV